jgi:DNA-binding NarL/FixJ family response regulator
MTGAPPLRALVVDDHPVFRRGVVAVLQAGGRVQVVAEAASAPEAVEAFRQHRPDVVVLDMRMPGGGGLEVLRALTGEAPPARVVVMSSYLGDADIRAALAAGARSYLGKDVPADEMLRAIETVAAGGRYVPPAVAQRLAEGRDGVPLTARELEVLRLVALGHSNKDIAGALSIEESTVKVHVRSILGKLEVDQRTEAAIVALQRGIIHLD